MSDTLDLLAGVLDKECIHLLTVRTCTICKKGLFDNRYAKMVPSKKAAKVETVVRYCALCPNKGKKDATIRLPRTPHGLLEGHDPWCNHEEGFCSRKVPTVLSGPTVQVPKIFKATHQLPDGRWICDTCCHDGCKRCRDIVPKRKARKMDQMKPLSASDLFG